MATKLKRLELLDATPERLAKGDASELVNPAEIDSVEQPIGMTRRFKSSRLDRLYNPNHDKKRPSALTHRQWAAGDWYRNQWARCRFSLSVVSSYGERSFGGEINYGLPRTEAQLRARKLFMEARAHFPSKTLGFMERFLLHDDLPRYGGNQYYRSLNDIRFALDRLADWLAIN